MINKYTMLGSMYRYQSSSGTWSSKKVKAEFLETTLARNFISRAIVKRDVLKTYDIVDKASCVRVVEGLFSRSVIEDPSILVLYQMWNRYEGIPDESAIKKALDEEFDFKDIVEFYYTGISEIIPQVVGADEYIKSIKNNLMILYKDGHLDLYINFFQKYNWLLRIVGRSFLIGFDIARAVEVLKKSYEASFISEADCMDWLNRIGNASESRFISWEQYLASCLAGKIFNLFDGTERSLSILKETEFINAVFGLTLAPNKLLLSSDLWLDSDLFGFAKELDKHFNFGVHKHKETENCEYCDSEMPAINLAKRVVFTPAITLGLGAYFSALEEKGNFYHPLMAVGRRFLFWDVIDRRNEKYHIDIAPDEIPFLMTNQATFTNKAVYIFERKVLIKRDLIPFKWEDVKFTFKVGFSCEFINVYINGHKVGYLPLYSSRVGIENESEALRMKDTVLNELFEKEEFPLLEQLFNGIPNRF